MHVTIHVHAGGYVTVQDGGKEEQILELLEELQIAVEAVADDVASSTELLAEGIGEHQINLLEVIEAFSNGLTGAKISADGPIEIVRTVMTRVRELDPDSPGDLGDIIEDQDLNRYIL